MSAHADAGYDHHMEQLQQVRRAMMYGKHSWLSTRVRQMEHNPTQWQSDLIRAKEQNLLDAGSDDTWLDRFVEFEVGQSMYYCMLSLQHMFGPNLLWQTMIYRHVRGVALTHANNARQRRFEQTWQTIFRQCCQTYLSHWRRVLNKQMWSVCHALRAENDPKWRRKWQTLSGMLPFNFGQFTKDIETAADLYHRGLQYKTPLKIQQYINQQYPNHVHRAYAAWHAIVRHWIPRATGDKKYQRAPRKIPFIMNANLETKPGNWIV